MLVFVTVLAVSSYWPDAENEYEDDFTLDAVFYPELLNIGNILQR